MRIGPLGIWEIILILVIVLLIFGPSRLPEMAKGIGQSVREFRKGIRDMKDDISAEVNRSDDESSAKKSEQKASISTEKSEKSEPAQPSTPSGNASSSNTPPNNTPPSNTPPNNASSSNTPS